MKYCNYFFQYRSINLNKIGEQGRAATMDDSSVVFNKLSLQSSTELGKIKVVEISTDKKLVRDERKKILILLDVSGLLCQKCNIKNRPKSKVDQSILKNYKTFLAGYYTVVARPGCRELVQTLCYKYHVGIFSSTTKYNLDKILHWLLGQKLLDQIKIVADRSRTKLDPRWKKDSTIKKHDTVKMLTDIWADPCFNYDRQWHNDNTIIVDHDLHKIRLNDPRNRLLLAEWQITAAQTNSDSILELIEAAIQRLMESGSNLAT